MRVHGYCTSCHRPRLVSARDLDVALALMRRGIAAGVCDVCAAEAEARRRRPTPRPSPPRRSTEDQ